MNEVSISRKGPPSLLASRRQLGQKVDEMIVKNMSGIVEQTEDGGITHRVEDVLSFFPAGDDVALAQHR